jgi:DNA-binding Lrp family transcriptional regulator
MTIQQLKLGFESREDEAAAIKAARADRARKMQLAAEQIGAQDGEHLYELAGMLAVFAGSPSALAMGCTGIQWIGSKKELAEHDRLQCHPNAVGRALARLEEAGIITRTTVRNARGQNAGVLIEIQMDMVNQLAKSPRSRPFYVVDKELKTAPPSRTLSPDIVCNDYGSADSNAHSSADSNNYGSAAYNICEPLYISNKSNNPLSPTTPTEAAKPIAAEQPVVVVEDDSQNTFDVTPEQRRDIETGAKMLAESIRSLDRRREEREHCWQVACAAVLLEGLHQVRQFVRSARTHARDEADYYRGTIRRFAEERGHKWHELRKQLPPCPKISTREANA